VLNARVEEVENARERVKKGVVQGIRSSNTFQGSINSRLIHLPTWNPYSDPFLIAYKAVFPIFPEPEIYYPAGTDIHLRTTKEVTCPQVSDSTAQEFLPSPKEESDAAAQTASDLTAQAESEKLDELVEQLPYRVTTSKLVNADLLNIVFLGTQDQVTAAFREAGWQNADPVSRRTVMKNLYAFLKNSGYPQEPMTTFFFDGRPEDMNWQKSLNSYDRRDHLRIWQWDHEANNDSIWISSSTHDTHDALSIKHHGFVHHIEPNIDDERATVIRDLNFAGCVRSVAYVSRPQMSITTRNATGDAMRTDGSIAVVTLQDCHPDPQLDPTPKGGNYKPGNITFRYIRRQILTYRNDIFRANIIYGAYDAGRRTVAALRRPPKIDP
jgi:LssY C-terminus